MVTAFCLCIVTQMMNVYGLMFICLGKISKSKIRFEPNLKGVQTRAGQPHYSETDGQSSLLCKSCRLQSEHSLTYLHTKRNARVSETQEGHRVTCWNKILGHLMDVKSRSLSISSSLISDCLVWPLHPDLQGQVQAQGKDSPANISQLNSVTLMFLALHCQDLEEQLSGIRDNYLTYQFFITRKHKLGPTHCQWCLKSSFISIPVRRQSWSKSEQQPLQVLHRLSQRQFGGSNSTSSKHLFLQEPEVATQ